MNYLNFMMLMLMIQLPFTDDQNSGGTKNKVKSKSITVCEWKLEEKNTELIFYMLNAFVSSFKPVDYVRRARQDDDGIFRFGVVSSYAGKVIVNFPVDSDGNVNVSFLRKKDGC